MKNSVTLKLLALPFIVIPTWMLTSALMSQRQSANASPQIASPPPKIASYLVDGKSKTIVVEEIGKTKASVTQRINPSPAIVSKHSLTSQEFAVAGNDVSIKASVKLMSKVGGVVHLWRLRAFRLDDNSKEFDKPYVEQLFEMDASGRMEPTFSEVIQLPAGRHRVVLSLYAVPKGYDLTELNDEQTASSAILINVPEIVDVQ